MRLYLYLKYFFQADTKAARNRAAATAAIWAKKRNPKWTYQYMLEVQRFSRAYMLNYCHLSAKSKLANLHPR